MTILAPGHRCDPQLATDYQRLVCLRRMLIRRPALSDTFAAFWDMMSSVSKPRVKGPIRLAHAAAKNLEVKGAGLPDA